MTWPCSSETGLKGRRGGDRAGQTPGYLVAYVGNVAFEASSEDVSALFEGCSVTRVRLHTDRDTGRPKGFAHVHFLDEPSLDRYPTPPTLDCLPPFPTSPRSEKKLKVQARNESKQVMNISSFPRTATTER